MSESDDPTDCCKIGRKAGQYDLDGLDADLIGRYETQEGSLRELAQYINVSILEKVLADIDADIAGDPESIYMTMSGDDADPTRQTTIRDQLIYAGVDVDDLERDFVSHQSVKKHLNSCLDVDTARDGVESIEEARELIEWARSRDEQIITKTLERLRRIDVLSTGPIDVTHSVSVTCGDCQRTYDILELLETGGCDCDLSSSDP